MLRWFAATLILVPGAVLPAQETVPTPQQGQPLVKVADELHDFVEVHCLDCHDSDGPKAGLDLTQRPLTLVSQLWRWSRVRERVAAHEMPPLSSSEVEVAERATFVQQVDALLARQVPQLALDPGQVTVRRLSRGQWRNTIRDLLGVAVDTSGLPVDDLGYGFDSIGDALTFSTLHLEKYLAASRAVAESVFHGEDPANPPRRFFEAEAMHLVNNSGANMSGGTANMYTNATIEQNVEVPRDGVYRVRIVAGARQAGNEPAKMLPELDGKRLEVIDVKNRRSREFVIETTLRGGRHKVALSFINDYYDPKNPDPKKRDRNLRVDSLEIVGPVDVPEVKGEQQWLHASLTGRSDEDRLRQMIAVMLPRLWRRDVTTAERERLYGAGVTRLRAGKSLVATQRFVLAAALTSPWFLFRIEDRAGSAAPKPLGGAELATRLSYFLWASAPDADLLALGRGDELHRPEVMAKQVDRLLRDGRAESLATEFAAQWFELRALADRTPDPDRFGRFDDGLRAAMARESELLFLAVLREDRDVRDLLDCDFTHVNRRLATFYGLPHEGDPAAFVRTELQAGDRLRGGLLGHGSMHVITSNPTRTSPVKRGKWLLENLLGQAPPPPPPGNDSFADEAAIDDSATLRQQMAQHRDRKKCAVCHVRMDALGLAMERFDAIGRFRKTDSAGIIDASGELPDGRKLGGLADLKKIMATDPAFVRTTAHKLFVYAVGREMRPVDRLRVDLRVRQLVRRGKVTVRDLIMVVVGDPAFANRANAVHHR